MLLKSIKLLNFRQFKNEEVEFSTDLEKNVTIIIGDNGSGKTTFAQAFFWCLYGEVTFKDKEMLNKDVQSDLTPQDSATVKVVLSLIHGDIEYEITREQIYRITNSKKLNSSNSKVNIQYTKNSEQKFVDELEVPLIIREILPKELSEYFFFDGEKIERMSREVQSGNKSYGFADAVQGLLGLDAFKSAIDHMGPKPSGVIGRYEKDFDSTGNDSIVKYTKEIEQYQNKLDEIGNKILEIEEEVPKQESYKKELEYKIKQYAESEGLQEKKQRLIEKKSNVINNKQIAIENLLKNFNNKSSSYLSRLMIKKSLEMLTKYDYTNKDIPEMHSKTVEFLVNKGTCLCGTPLDEGSEEYKTIIKLLEHLPPQSIGMTVNQFVVESQIRAKQSGDLFDSYSSALTIINGQEKTIKEYIDQITLIEENLEEIDSISSYQKELKTCEDRIYELIKKKEEYIEEKGKIKTKRDRSDTQRSQLALRDEKNKKIELYKSYAEHIYSELNEIYKENEACIRKKLQDNINNIFKTIYKGGLSITINDKYNISVYADGHEEYEDIETSTAQSVSVIFAFITAIIKMARKSNEGSDDEVNLLSSEPYPLVMDAPLSTFDKSRIKTICNLLPEIAEQVIIFIKDTDGDLAKEYMDHKIGAKYEFKKLSEFRTEVI